MRAAVYMRVSTSRQADEGESIPAQREALLQYVKAHDMKLVGEYIDGGASGTKADRDELKRLLDDVKADRIDTILFVKLDRWFRSVRHYTATQELLDKHGVTWTAIWEPIYDTSTPQGRLIVNQMMSIAQFEAENTSLRIRQVFEYKLSQNEVTSGKIPFGFSIVDKHLQPNADAEIMKKVFEFYARSGSLHATRDYAAGIGYDRDIKPLKQALMNTKYAGEYRGKPYCTPIIDRELFDAVQKRLHMNIKVSARRTYIFTGLVVCGKCGRRMSAASNHDGAYYRCPGKYIKYRRDCDNGRSPREKKIEQTLLAYLNGEKEYTAVPGDVIEESTDVIDAQIAELQKKVARLTDLYVNELIEIDEYTRRKAAFTAEIDTLDARRRAAQRRKTPDNAALRFTLGDLYPTMDNAEKRAFWREIVERIIIHPDSTIEPVFVIA